jgi:hypothetical protein
VATTASTPSSLAAIHTQHHPPHAVHSGEPALIPATAAQFHPAAAANRSTTPSSMDNRAPVTWRCCIGWLRGQSQSIDSQHTRRTRPWKQSSRSVSSTSPARPSISRARRTLRAAALRARRWLPHGAESIPNFTRAQQFTSSAPGTGRSWRPLTTPGGADGEACWDSTADGLTRWVGPTARWFDTGSCWVRPSTRCSPRCVRARTLPRTGQHIRPALLVTDFARRPCCSSGRRCASWASTWGAGTTTPTRDRSTAPTRSCWAPWRADSRPCIATCNRSGTSCWW